MVVGEKHPLPSGALSAKSLATRLKDLQQHLAECRQTLAQLDAQRAQVQTALLRLEGAVGVVQELIVSVT